MVESLPVDPAPVFDSQLGQVEYFRSTTMVPNVYNPPHDRSVPEYLPWYLVFLVPKNSGTFKLDRVYVIGSSSI